MPKKLPSHASMYALISALLRGLKDGEEIRAHGADVFAGSAQLEAQRPQISHDRGQLNRKLQAAANYRTDGHEHGDPNLPTYTIYRPANLGKVPGKLPLVAFGSGGCFNQGNCRNP